MRLLFDRVENGCRIGKGLENLVREWRSRIPLELVKGPEEFEDVEKGKLVSEGEGAFIHSGRVRVWCRCRTGNVSNNALSKW